MNLIWFNFSKLWYTVLLVNETVFYYIMILLIFFSEGIIYMDFCFPVMFNVDGTVENNDFPSKTLWHRRCQSPFGKFLSSSDMHHAAVPIHDFKPKLFRAIHAAMPAFSPSFLNFFGLHRVLPFFFLFPNVATILQTRMGFANKNRIIQFL